MSWHLKSPITRISGWGQKVKAKPVKDGVITGLKRSHTVVSLCRCVQGLVGSRHGGEVWDIGFLCFPTVLWHATHVHLLTPNFTCTNSISGLQEPLVCQQNCPPSLWDISDEWHVIIAMELACCQDLSSCHVQKWSIMCAMLSFIKKCVIFSHFV